MKTRFLLLLFALPLLLLSSCDEKDGPTIIPPKEKPAYYDVAIRTTDHERCKEITLQDDGSYFVDWTDGFDSFFFMDIQLDEDDKAAGAEFSLYNVLEFEVKGATVVDNTPLIIFLGAVYGLAELLLGLQEFHSHIDRLGEGDLQLHGRRTQSSRSRTMDMDARRHRCQCAHPDFLHPQHPSDKSQPREQISPYRHRGSLRPTGTEASAN